MITATIVENGEQCGGQILILQTKEQEVVVTAIKAYSIAHSKQKLPKEMLKKLNADSPSGHALGSEVYILTSKESQVICNAMESYHKSNKRLQLVKKMYKKLETDLECW